MEKQMYFVDTDAELSPIACAYIRARGADRLCSYGDWAALSDTCDAATARYLAARGVRRHHRPRTTPTRPWRSSRPSSKGNYNVVQDRPGL
ncbi:MAG: hypothetical protein ACLUNZ_12550 [Evtepia sp.]